MKLVLNSHGLNTQTGTKQIKESLEKLGHNSFTDSSIFVVSHPDYGIDDLIVNNLVNSLGFYKENIYLSAAGIPKCTPDYIYVTEGNTYEILYYMQRYGLTDYIKEIMRSVEPPVYIGSSAGAIIAGTDIKMCSDTNVVGFMDYSGLCLFEGTIIPHCSRVNLKTYLENTDEHLLNRYKKIYSVGDDEAITLESI